MIIYFLSAIACYSAYNRYQLRMLAMLATISNDSHQGLAPYCRLTGTERDCGIADHNCVGTICRLRCAILAILKASVRAPSGS